MSILVIGGTGFIGRRVVRRLAQLGAEIVCTDINSDAACFADLHKQVKFVRSDLSRFDELMEVMALAKPSVVVNLGYLFGENPPRIATKVNVVGVDNCFEASRLLGVQHVVYASSTAVSGKQSSHSKSVIDENDPTFPTSQYGVHKVFNEFQAFDYRSKYGMRITGIRIGNVAGPDKFRGSIDHVDCITYPTRGRLVTLPYRDLMRCVIHVEDIADVFARIALAAQPKHNIYFSGGAVLSLGQLADIVAEFLPEAKIEFTHETGGRDASGAYSFDNSRLLSEFGFEYPPYRTRVLDIINDVRRSEGLPPIIA